jgi:hypothetical protein
MVGNILAFTYSMGLLSSRGLPKNAEVEFKKFNLPKKVPNPNGKNGGPSHQTTIKNTAADLESQGYKIIDYEYYVKTNGGYKNARYGDILVESPTGERIIIQVGKQTSGGLPVSRELKAIQDLQNAGYKVQFVPYN